MALFQRAFKAWQLRCYLMFETHCNLAASPVGREGGLVSWLTLICVPRFQQLRAVMICIGRSGAFRVY